MRSATTASAAFFGVIVLARVAAGQAGPDGLGAQARVALPAVVTVTVPEVFGPEVPDAAGPSAGLLDELFDGVLMKGRRQAVAAGVILDPEGLVITAAHAVAGAGDVEATTADGVSRKATVIGLDRKTDIAALRLRGPGPFPHARLGDSDAVRVGDWVAAIGSPYGLGTTVTRGIISAMPRARPRAAVDDLLQTDATTFPDSAGGPLVDARGEVIGFTTVLTLHDFGISFAMPSNAARKIVGQLVREGVVARGSLDVRFQGLTPGLGRALGLPDAAGLLVADINPRGAAATAGIRQGDVLRALDGRPVEAPYDVEHVLRTSTPAQTIELTHWRRGRTLVTRVSLGQEGEPAPAPPLSSRTGAILQFDVRALTPELGVVVSLVRPDRAVAEPGLRVGDIIREIDQEPIRTIADLERLVDAVRPGDWLALLVQRGRVAVYVAVRARQSAISEVPGMRRP